MIKTIAVEELNGNLFYSSGKIMVSETQDYKFFKKESNLEFIIDHQYSNGL